MSRRPTDDPQSQEYTFVPFTHFWGGDPRSASEDRALTRHERPIQVLAISGSLRSRSSNTEILRAASSMAPKGIRITLFTSLDALPHFNPDLDAEGMTPPPAVGEFRKTVAEADALLISTPEYAHGVPGSLKNALDWLVSFPDVIYKPVAVLNPSPRSWHAVASLTETLRTMSLTVVPSSSSIAVPVSDRKLTATALRQDPDFVTALRSALSALASAAREHADHRYELGGEAPL